MWFRQVILSVAIFLSFGNAYALAAQERIIEFVSDITVKANADVEVVETLQVESTGNKIQRGIYRDFPTEYRDKSGRNVKVGFEILSIQRDGQREPYHIKAIANGKRIYIGDKDVFLGPGIYTYRIHYRTNRQLGFFSDYDELYWNVTGNGWDFPIEQAIARVTLPEEARITQYAVYTGKQGEKGQDFVSYPDKLGMTYATTRKLLPREGMTIAVAWPKGYVKQPTDKDKLRYFFDDNKGLGFELAIVALVLSYYLFVWGKVGRDPRKGPIVPLFSPPKGISPALAYYIQHMGVSSNADKSRSFAAALVNMAVKGAVKLSEEDDEYTIEKTNLTVGDLSAGEKVILRELFDGEDQVVFKRSNHRHIRNAMTKFIKKIEGENSQFYFKTNSKYLIPGFALSALALVAIYLNALDGEQMLFMTLWLSIWTIGCVTLAHLVITAWKLSSVAKGKGIMGAIGITLFALPFWGSEIMGIYGFAEATSWSSTLIFIGLIMISMLFSYLLKAPTMKGRQVLDKIEGFKLFLTVAEKERLAMFHPPDLTPEVFEKCLPYAMAMGVAHEWSQKFADTFVGIDKEAYSPKWYSGSRGWHAMGPMGFGSHLQSSLAQNVASSSTPPGSSSGSGGGGFSGGGGGGGGGGGW